MWNDLRFAWRTCRRSPGFVLVAVLSLALAVGANTAIFSLLYQVVLRSIPVRDPQTLVTLESNDYSFGMTRRDNNQTVFSYPMYLALRDHNRVFSGLVARAGFPATLAWRGESTRTMAEIVTGNFFEVLGVKPALGRLLVPSDDSAVAENPAIVLGHSYWATRLGRDPSVLNSRVLMNGRPVVVVGVAAESFRGIISGRTPDFFAPVSVIRSITPDWDKRDQVDAYWLNVLGRLRPGVTHRQADAMLAPLYHSFLEDELPRFNDVTAEARKKILAKPLRVQPAAKGLNEFGDRWKTPLAVLMVMVGLVLLIACANVSGLLIARATAREREIAIRLALGASGRQLVRQLMVESLAITLAGGMLGLLVSENLTNGLLHLLPADESGGWLAAQLDFRLFWFSLALSLIAGVLVGVFPALRAKSPDLAPALKERASGSSASSSRARRVLVVAQICLSLLLLSGAGLFTQSLVNLLKTDLGFRADHLVTFAIDPSLNGYSHERSLNLFRQIEERLLSLPGAALVARSAYSPFGGWGWGNGVKAPGTRAASEQYADCASDAVGPGYFRTLGIALVAGREFEAADTAKSSKVAIINQSFAKFLFEDANPLGRHLITGSNDVDMQIVGIVHDSKYNDVREKPRHFLYIPYDQAEEAFTRQATFFVRTQGGEQAMMAAVRTAVKQLEPSVPVDWLSSMRLMIGDFIYKDRLIATLAIAFGALASLLAAVGLYGTISYSATRRTREFGIRLALGAVPRSLLLAVMREVGVLAAIGIACGLPLSYALGRLVQSQFYGVSAYDPLVLAAGTVLICGVAFLAGLAPAVRAMGIEPVRALRYE
ncbi:MAG TPA: ABC transporter permease [Bryobacteraceae bacterium]|nr:ABC transporter permease [Bryobacteraceae bacterium]